MKCILFISLLCLCSCVSKNDYNNLGYENEELKEKITKLESDISMKNNKIRKLESSLDEAINNSNNYHETSIINADKGKDILEQLSTFLYETQRALSDYNNNSDINMAYQACRYWKSEIDSYLFHKY